MVHRSYDVLPPWTAGLFFATVLPAYFQTVDHMLWNLWKLQSKKRHEKIRPAVCWTLKIHQLQNSREKNPGWRAQWRHQEIWEGVETSLDALLRGLDVEEEVMGSNCNWCSLGLAEIYRDSWNKNCQIQAFAPLQVGIHDFLNCMTHATYVYCKCRFSISDETAACEDDNCSPQVMWSSRINPLPRGLIYPGLTLKR